jgi:hypothetical protein
VVLKPGSRVVESSTLLVRILARAGFPADAVGFLPASGGQLGEYLVSHPGVDLVAFSGSRSVALRVAEVAGRRDTGSDRVKRVVADVDRVVARRPDAAYLVQFLEPRVVTENTLRRGFVPPEQIIEEVR